MRNELNYFNEKNLTRYDRWSKFISDHGFKTVLEIGVFKGLLAEPLLRNCGNIKKYIMVDPWRNMPDWNSKYNFSEDMESCFQETLKRTEFAKDKRDIKRGTTLEVIDEINDRSVDFAYVDGDHSLRGVSIDLIKTWDKISDTGYLAGHDLKSLCWKSDTDLEPYLVFPFAVYFAEAMNAKIYALPSSEFIISKGEKGFELIDLAGGRYKDTSILGQVYRLPFRYLLKIFRRKIGI